MIEYINSIKICKSLKVLTWIIGLKLKNMKAQKRIWSTNRDNSKAKKLWWLTRNTLWMRRLNSLKRIKNQRNANLIRQGLIL